VSITGPKMEARDCSSNFDWQDVWTPQHSLNICSSLFPVPENQNCVERGRIRSGPLFVTPLPFKRAQTWPWFAICQMISKTKDWPPRRCPSGLR
jgi:hypothetical protein